MVAPASPCHLSTGHTTRNFRDSANNAALRSRASALVTDLDETGTRAGCGVSHAAEMTTPRVAVPNQAATPPLRRALAYGLLLCLGAV